MEEHMAHLNKRGIRSEYYTIPNGYYFLIGDNIAESEDSRIFGAIPKDSIKAKIVEL
jgi:signal peptidase I